MYIDMTQSSRRMKRHCRVTFWFALVPIIRSTSVDKMLVAKQSFFVFPFHFCGLVFSLCWLAVLKGLADRNNLNPHRLRIAYGDSELERGIQMATAPQPPGDGQLDSAEAQPVTATRGGADTSWPSP